jgi:cold shock CspA family protein
MQIPLQLSFRNFDPSAAVEAAVRKRVDKLERIDSSITSCRVTIEQAHRHHQKGNLFHVVVDVRTPAGEVAVSRMPDDEHAHEDVYVAIRDAFDAVRRRLQDQLREAQGKVKAHETPPHGTITELWPPDDYGRITGSDGREIYFHRNAVVNAAFDDLEIGAEVRFVEEAGDRGPQASSVQLIGKHHIVG